MRKLAYEYEYQLISFTKIHVMKNVRTINPSVAKNVLYFRILELEQNFWKSGILLFQRDTSEIYTFMPPTDTESTIACGFEDLRIFDYHDDVWFTSATRGKKNKFYTVIGRFNPDFSSYEIILTIIDKKEHKKNIVPLIHNQNLYLIDIFTRTVYQYHSNQDQHQLKPNGLRDPLRVVKSLKLCGSTQFLPLDSPNTYGGIVHNFRVVSNVRVYSHYWLEINVHCMEITFLSRPFFIHHQDVEFVSGIEQLPNGLFQLYYGISDKIAYACAISLDTLRGKIKN